MFNQAGFNWMNFNTFTEIEIILTATLRGHGGIKASLSAEFLLSATLNGESSISGDYVREIVQQALLEGHGEIYANMLREILMQAKLDGHGELFANLAKFKYQAITFNGEFKPGDKIVIDSKMLTFTLNGQNALQRMQGDFFNLNTGNNEIVYTDTASGRNVLVRITHRDKFV